MGFSSELLFERYPALLGVYDEFTATVAALCESFESGGTLFTCGNGGSAADADHIVGELMKGFLLPRRLPDDEIDEFERVLGAAGAETAKGLQMGLRAISLNGHPALNSAFANDENPSLVYAQQLFVLGNPGDVLLVISTSGNSTNIIRCLEVARVIGVKSVLLGGGNGGNAAKMADISLLMPETETYKIQEYHLPVYHALCAAIEEEFYGD